MFTKALGSGADIVCVELEDGVAPHDTEPTPEASLSQWCEH